MHDPEKSDSGIVAMKPMNKAGRPAAELAEPRPGTKGNADQQSTHRTQSRARVTQALDRVRKAARQRKKEQFTSLLHHMNVDLLRTAFYALKRKAAPGVDGMMWADYEADLEPRLEDLHGRVHRGAYRPRPSRRTYIPKADGKQRPLAIAALEDKIVQGATVMLLNAIYEGDFCGFSYGFPDTQDLSARRIGNVVVKSASDRPWSQYFCCMLAGNRDFMREHPIATKHVVRALLKAADICVTDPARVARILVDGGFTPRYDYALQMLSELPYDKWREYDPEDTIRFYALRLREAGLIKSSPQKIISDGTDWRFLNELKRELKA